MTRAVVTFEIDGQTKGFNAEADRMTIHGETLLVYDGDDLAAMFRESDVRAAYITKPKGGIPCKIATDT